MAIYMYTSDHTMTKISFYLGMPFDMYVCPILWTNMLYVTEAEGAFTVDLHDMGLQDSGATLIQAYKSGGLKEAKALLSLRGDTTLLDGVSAIACCPHWLME